MANDLAETVDDLVSSIDELEEVLAPLLAIPLSELTTRLSAPLDRAKLQVWLSYVLNDLVWIQLRTRGHNPNNVGGGETHDVVAELDRVKSYFSKIKEAEDPAKRSLVVDGKVANRFIKHALASAISPANFASTSTHTRFDEDGNPDQPIPTPSKTELSNAASQSEDLPSSSSDDEEPEVGTWKAKRRAREADLALSQDQDDASEEDEPMSGWEEPGSTGVAPIPGDVALSTGTSERPVRTRIDPFAGYDDPSAKPKQKRPKQTNPTSSYSLDADEAASPSPSASSSVSGTIPNKKNRRGTKGGVKTRSASKKSSLAREALERAATGK